MKGIALSRLPTYNIEDAPSLQNRFDSTFFVFSFDLVLYGTVFLVAEGILIQL